MACQSIARSSEHYDFLTPPVKIDNKPKFVTNFINLYRSLPCLWKVGHHSYKNKRVKEDAYAKLLTFYKTAIPSATIDTVKRKINNLRCAFRKEHKRVQMQESGASVDDSYTSSLWYFDLLMFTVEQESPSSSTASDSHIEVMIKDEPISEDDEPMPSIIKTSPSPPPCLQLTPHSPPLMSPIEPISSLPNKRKAGTVQEYYDEYDGIGFNIACKLRRMNEEQRLYAEMIINKVILYGLTHRLQEDTNLTGLVPKQSHAQ